MLRDTTTGVQRKKLIEVALPLDAINRAAAREKSIRYGHPSSLHLWWARRPLAAARAVIFAQMVDDPSSRPELFPTAQAQDQERQRLFDIITQLVTWENTNNESILTAAHDEIPPTFAGRPPVNPKARLLARTWTGQLSSKRPPRQSRDLTRSRMHPCPASHRHCRSGEKP